MCRAIVAAVIVLAAWVPTHAQQASIGAFTDSGGIWCGIEDSGPGVIPIYIVAQFPFGVTATQFLAPIPSCFVGATWVSDTFVFPVTVGNSQTGVAIGFGGCRLGRTHVLTINVQVQGLTEGCCRYAFLPHPDATLDGLEFTDCDFNLFVGTEYASFVTEDGQWTAPLVSDLQPIDGAIDQPLDTKLTWDLYYCSCGLGVRWDTVYFGTTPDPPEVAETWDHHGYDPGPLRPNTMYYWKVRASDSDAGSTTTTVFTFTTERAVPIEPTTWGRIKGLYGG